MYNKVSPKTLCDSPTESCEPPSQVEQMTREISYLAGRIEEYNRVIKFHQEHPDVVALLKEKKLEVHSIN